MNPYINAIAETIEKIHKKLRYTHTGLQALNALVEKFKNNDIVKKNKESLGRAEARFTEQFDKAFGLISEVAKIKLESQKKMFQSDLSNSPRLFHKLTLTTDFIEKDKDRYELLGTQKLILIEFQKIVKETPSENVRQELSVTKHKFYEFVERQCAENIFKNTEVNPNDELNFMLSQLRDFQNEDVEYKVLKGKKNKKGVKFDYEEYNVAFFEILTRFICEIRTNYASVKYYPNLQKDIESLKQLNDALSEDLKRRQIKYEKLSKSSPRSANQNADKTSPRMEMPSLRNLSMFSEDSRSAVASSPAPSSVVPVSTRSGKSNIEPDSIFKAKKRSSITSSSASSANNKGTLRRGMK